MKETILVTGGTGFIGSHTTVELQAAGYDVVIVNNNPETVSTDFDTADRLYFEPLTPEDVMGVINTEKPLAFLQGVVFGDFSCCEQITSRSKVNG